MHENIRAFYVRQMRILRITQHRTIEALHASMYTARLVSAAEFSWLILRITQHRMFMSEFWVWYHIYTDAAPVGAAAITASANIERGSLADTTSPRYFRQLWGSFKKIKWVHGNWTLGCWCACNVCTIPRTTCRQSLNRADRRLMELYTYLHAEPQ